ncbi:hypothetical protein PRUPE_I006000 [Prunus persica]|uniref:Uncharacterized protein n=1 Tax=Prunus persica TaxID=3760 RepID=A0A1R3L4Z7_PRUPE|nr:hypothetical protein PRUPE_I006000 [Prunus persica]
MQTAQFKNHNMIEFALKFLRLMPCVEIKIQRVKLINTTNGRTKKTQLNQTTLNPKNQHISPPPSPSNSFSKFLEKPLKFISNPPT